MLRVRKIRKGDWPACMELDTSYETESAWQMEEQSGEGQWSVRFTEVRLPRKQRIMPRCLTSVHPAAEGAAIPRGRSGASGIWQERDGFWVAVESREICGYLGAVLECDHSQVRITELAVAPAWRRRRVATELLAHVTTWSVRQNVDQLVFECSPKAQPAISFAMFHGFTFCGFQDAYWPRQEVGLFFRKRIH